MGALHSSSFLFLSSLITLPLHVHLLAIIKEALIQRKQMMSRKSMDYYTSRLASKTLGTMWGRQRPSINITLSSLSAIRETCNKRGYWGSIL